MPVHDRSIAWLRGVLIVGVLLVHADMLFESDPNTALNYANTVVGPILMPAVLALSGYLTNRHGPDSVAGFVAARAKRLLWPYAIWCAIYAPFLLYVEGKFDSWARVVVYAIIAPSELGPVWFLIYLFVFSCAVRVFKGVPAWLLLLLTLIAALSVYAVRGDGAAVIVHFCGFLTGLTFRESRRRLDELPRDVWFGVAVLTVMFLFVLPLVHGDGNRDNVIAAPLVVAGCAVALRYKDVLHGLFGATWFEHVGTNSLNYYLPHWPIMLVVHSTIDASGSQSMAFLTFLLGLGVPIIIGEILSRRLGSVAAVDMLFNFPRQKV